jgi:glycosyltransferase involved in cell wall biosynthesis
MKIAIIVPSLINRGPVIVVKDIVEQLNGRVALIKVFYLDNIPVELSFNCEVEKLSLTSLSKQLSSFDIVHSHMLRPNILISILPLKNVKKIATLHNYMYEDISNTHNKVVAKIIQSIWVYSLKNYNKVICLTNNMKEYYNNLGIEKSNLSVIYNGRPKIELNNIQALDSSESLLISEFKSRFFVLGVTALLSQRKGIDQLIKVLKSTPNVGLMIIGDGPEKDSLMILAKKLGVHSQCLFLGYKQKIYKYFKYFDGFAMPSLSEGFPLAFIEASSFGLPILVSDIPIFREIATEKEVVFVKLNDSKSMIFGINNLIENKDQYSSASYHAFINRFDSIIMGNNYFNLYKNIYK